DELTAQDEQLKGYLSQVQAGEDKLSQVPVEFAGVLVIAVPGVPAVSVSNPDAATALAVLSARRDFWKSERATLAGYLQSVDQLLDASDQTREPDDFGDSVPRSAVVYRAEEQQALDLAQKDVTSYEAQVDAVTRTLAQAGASPLPTLSGRSIDDLRQMLPSYVDELHAQTIPDGPSALDARIDKIDAARLVPFLADAVVRGAEAEAKVKALDDALNGVLPAARTQFSAAVSAVDALLADVDADVAYVNAGFPASEATALISRKRQLVEGTLKPMLTGLLAFIENTLIPYQRSSIATADPQAAADGYATLYKEKQYVYQSISDSYKTTMPWSLASEGAPDGNVAAANAGIQAERQVFAPYRQMVTDYLTEIKRRKDPNDAGSEMVYGESMPYSLVKRIAQYRSEETTRAADIDRLAGQVDDILKQIDALTQGKSGLAARFTLPTDIKPNDAGSASRLNAIANGQVIQNLAAALQAIASAAPSGGTSISVGSGSGGGIAPVGTQPSPTLSTGQQEAVLALDAVKRLIPSTLTTGGGSLTEAMARYLFADGVAAASEDSLDNQIPVFQAYLDKANGALASVSADLDADAAYVAGGKETADALYARKLSLYQRLMQVANEGAALFNQKAGWDQSSSSTVQAVAGYYGTLQTIYSDSSQALDAEQQAAQEYKASLDQTKAQLDSQRTEVTGWLQQLNNPDESAMNRISENLSAIQDKTKAVLEACVQRADAKKRYDAAAAVLQETLDGLQRERGALSAALKGIDLRDLSADTERRVEALGLGGSAWLAPGPSGQGAIVIKKSQFASFLSTLFGGFDAESSSRDLAQMRSELLKNPLALAQLLPNSRMMQVGDDADGFYLVYDSAFSTPNGLETSSQVTLGNVLKLWGSNVSVTGYRVVSPPNAANAPYGDQGVTVSVETLGNSSVNYLDVTLHKFIQDVPSDITPSSQANQDR
ncbi:MAG: hypothetical protein KGL53_14710, partial [Elusimicrobia bacterium]|nr:hypothetical protein [Elusimicrobiota bacterium]